MPNPFRKKRRERGERDASFYDELYRRGGYEGQYHVSYRESRYLPVWERAVEILLSMDRPSVLDIGCGPGQFAELLHDSGISGYAGVDHSSVAVEMARRAVPEWAGRFSVGDAFAETDMPGEHDVVVIFEVLEHIEGDRELLARIEPDTPILFSVPSYLSASHVRRFRSSRAVRRRYAGLVSDLRIEPFAECPEPGKTIYLGHGSTARR